MRRIAVLLALALGVSVAACGSDDKPRVNGEGGSGGDGGGGGGSGGTPADATFDLPGLSAPARVRFDEQGVLHATCRTDEDCAAVLGYFHASNRFFQMDLQRRLARGRLSELVGAFTLEQDVASRHFMTTRDGTPIEEAIWSEAGERTRSVVEAYSGGVNAWIADLKAGRNGAALTEDYQVVGVGAQDIAEWDPLDTVAFARLMTMQLSESSAKDLAAGSAFAALPAERAVAFLTVAPGARAYTMPASGVSYAPQQQEAFAPKVAPTLNHEAIHGLQLRLNEVASLIELAKEYRPHQAFGIDGDPAGSNNWVVGPSLAGGKTLLANDPHLGLSNPAVWYLAHLDSKTEGEGTLNVAGGSFPGIPGIPIGRNENVAWGATVAYFDVTDVYVETLDDQGTHVLFDPAGGAAPAPVAILEKDFTFQVKGQGAVTRTLRWVPHHGPMVAFDQANKRGMSVRWTGHEPSQELDAFLDLAGAGTVDEAIDALRSFEVGAQNFVLADTAGKIAWFPHAKVPLRPWASFDVTDPGSMLPPWMPLPGDGRAEWQGFLDGASLPQMVDPPNAFIATANQDMTGATEDGDPTNDGFPYLQSWMAPGFREARIVDLLTAHQGDHTVDSMHAIQADTFSLPGELIVPALLETAEGAELSERANALVAALGSWELTCPTGLTGSSPQSDPDPDPVAARESIGCSAFHYSLNRIFDKAYGDELAASGAPATAEQLIRPLAIALHPEWLPGLPFDPNVLWDDMRTQDVVETKEEILRAALEAAATDIANAMGSNPDGWRWGKVHTVTFSSALAALDPTGRLQDGPYANDGGLFTVDVANPSATARGKNFQHTSGASLRIVNEATSEGIVTWLQLPGGQDLHRTGEHFGDLVEGWLKNEPFRLPFTAAEVEAAAMTTIDMVP